MDKTAFTGAGSPQKKIKKSLKSLDIDDDDDDVYWIYVLGGVDCAT